MKTIQTLFTKFKHVNSLILMMFISLISFAQDAPEKVDVNISTDGGGTWFGQPWVWAVGVAIFILVLVIVTRSGKGSRD